MVTSRQLALAAGLLCTLAWAPWAAADTEVIVKTACVACHGEGGNSAVPLFPKLAGLQVEYLEKQLKDFLAGKRKSEVMAPTMAGLKDRDVAGLAAYYAAQKPTPGKVEDPKLVDKGKLVFDDGNTTSGVPACVGCHQPGAAGNERYPRLAGQHQAYTGEQMRQFKSGGRSNDKAKVMRAVAERMTDEEIAAVGEYLAGLP